MIRRLVNDLPTPCGGSGAAATVRPLRFTCRGQTPANSGDSKQFRLKMRAVIGVVPSCQSAVARLKALPQHLFWARHA
jgi:hypothetical protein